VSVGSVAADAGAGASCRESNMKRALFPFIVALLMAFAACGQGGSSPPPPPVGSSAPPPRVVALSTLRPTRSADQAIAGLSFFSHGEYILVRVIESFPERPAPPELRRLHPAEQEWGVFGRVQVLKSWWAPFSPGQLVYVGEITNRMLIGILADNIPAPLRLGDELFIELRGTKEPIFAPVNSTWPAAESQGAMAILDRAVELEDPTTEPHRARERERQRVMQAWKECFAQPGNAWTTCRRIDLSVLTGIERSKLVANWGPPTWCRDLNFPNEPNLRPIGADCAPEQMAIWTFHQTVTLSCRPENSRCDKMMPGEVSVR
jgi:hypothetical protein